MGRFKDLTGQRFGRLTVVGRAGIDLHRKITWNVVCDCGTKCVILGNDLRSGARVSCSCLKNEKAAARMTARRLPPGEYGFRALLNNYKSRARKRGIEWQLSYAEFKEMTQGLCFYCGKTPSQTLIPGTRSADLKKHGAYTYNGVDRVDSSGNYTVKNCVTCCRDCNYIKLDYDTEFLHEHLTRMLDHANKTGWGGTKKLTTDTADDTARRQDQQRDKSAE